MTNGEGRVPVGALPSSRRGAVWLRLGLVAVLDALVVAAIPLLIATRAWALLALLSLTALLVNWAYLSPRARAMRWLTPGLVLMGLFVIWPVVYTGYVSLTNWATGNALSKDQVIDRLERTPIETTDGGMTLEMAVYENPEGRLALWLLTPEGETYFGEPRSRSEEPAEDPLLDAAGLGVVDEDDDGIPERVGDFRRLSPLEVTGLAARGVIDDNTVLDIPGVGVAVVQTTSSARLVEEGRRYTYDPETDTLYDAQADVVCEAGVGNFVCPDGRRIDPGWREVVGFGNFSSILTNTQVRGPFLRVFTWNLIFAIASVVLTFALGLALANALQHPRVRGRPLYRSVFIIPYAVPGFLSIIVWRGLLNDQFGQVNRLIEALGVQGPPWLLDGAWAQIALLLVNTWLGFPYMFLICSGALEAIPAELKEAARVDGAGPWRVFRTITLPLLLVSTAPLLIGAFAFNFNNFVLVFLLTNGGPPIVGADVPVGHTDLLITFTFDLAVRGGRGNNFALGSAVVILIFIVVGVLSALSFRMTKRLEDVYGNL